MSRLRWIAAVVVSATGAAVGVTAGGLALLASSAYSVADLERGGPDSHRILDRHGAKLREVVNGRGARARWTPLADISPEVAAATIAVEDARFFEHHGVDLTAVVRAAAQNLVARRVVSGASTITMQLSRLVKPHPKSMKHKVLEAFDALRIESFLGKPAILEQYLNRAPYGGGTIGVEAASHRYFGKPSSHLSLAEAAMIAGLPKAPGRLDPTRNLAGALARQRTVLRRLLETGAIEANAHDRAVAEGIALTPAAAPAAMHFTDWVLSQRPRPGEVRTTLDGGLQGDLEGIVEQHVARVAGGGATNAAVVVLDNSDCGVLGMVGSADYWASDDGAVNGALARRQPGSTLKPFAYALAFERGATPASVVADVPTQYPDASGRVFAPQNFSKRFSGPVLMGEALARSLNVPAVRVANLYGAKALLDRLHDVGFASLDQGAGHYGLGLVLGNGEVTLLELATGYASLARGGRTCTASGVVGGGADGKQAFSEDVAFLITDILSDERLRVAAFGPSNALMLPFAVAAKTGTSSNWRDNWAVGYTDRYTVAVWSGDFGGRSMNHLAGVTGAGPLFADVMRHVVASDPNAAPPAVSQPPRSVVSLAVCARSGRLPTAHCRHRRTVRVQAAHAPTEPCPWHAEVAIDRRHGLMASARCPKRYVVREVFEILPAVYAPWLAAHDGSPPLPGWSPDCPPDGPAAEALVVTHPSDGQVFIIEPGYDRHTQTLPLNAQVEPAVQAVTWWLDGRRLGSAGWPYASSWALQRGRHQLIATAGTLRSDPIRFQVR